MAKKAASAQELPSMNVAQQAPRQSDQPEKPKRQPARTQAPKVETGLLEVPLGPLLGGYAKNRVDTKLTKGQAELLKKIKAGLEATDARLQSGRHVTQANHVIQWLLENVQA